MASAAVLPPPDVHLAQTTAEAFSGTSAFIGTKNISKDGTQAAANALASDTAAVDYFAFSDTPFVDLQAYLVSALRLPEDQVSYELLYPKDVFQARLKEHDETLYDRTRVVINDIYKHCSDFKANTFNTLISTAGYIANFSETAAKQSAIARGALPTLCTPGAKFTDPKVEEALGIFVDAVNILRTEAKKAAAQCNEKVVAIGKFKDLTIADKDKLENVKKLNEEYLPTVSDLNNENQAKMQAAYEKLNKICKEQNKVYDSLKPFVQFFQWVPILNSHVAFADIRKELKAINGIRKATVEYSQIFNQSSTEMKAALRFRGQAKNLLRSMNDVLATIGKAEKALSDMSGWFSNLETSLAAIESVLEQAVGHASDSKWSFQRKKAYDDLDDAGKRWTKVVDLAQRFQARGLIASTEMDKQLQTDLEPAEKYIEILSTNYGAGDVTDFSQVLFRYGDSIRIRSIEPGFPETWDGVIKTISMVHQYDGKLRLYVCKEFTDFHILSPGPISNYKGSPTVSTELDVSKTRLATCDIEILAVVYGPDNVTFKKQENSDTKVLHYVYSCFQKGAPIVFNNPNMGGDPWHNTMKSGTVFYRANGGRQVHQLTAREGEQVSFPH